MTGVQIPFPDHGEDQDIENTVKKAAFTNTISTITNTRVVQIKQFDTVVAFLDTIGWLH